MNTNLFEIFNQEKIKVIDINIGMSSNNHFSIEFKNKIQLKKWLFFCEKLKEKNIADFENDYLTLKVKIHDEKINEFYDMLSKKYYTVNPKRKHISLLVKPTVACNLDCQYCYDKPHKKNIKTTMSFETVEKLCELLKGEVEEVTWIWHGGEPTLMGVEWFEHVHSEIISKYPMLKFKFSIMSNGINYDEEFLKVFKKYNIDTGSSYNMFHQDDLRTSGTEVLQGDLILNNIKNYNQKNKRTGVIEVITKTNYKQQIEIYEEYKKLDIGLSMNHIFHTEATETNDIEVEFKEYAREFKKYFNHYLYDVNGVYERSAMEIINLVIGSNELTCVHSDCRNNWIGIMANGDLYPCDRYYSVDYRMGNLHEHETINSIYTHKGYEKYVTEVQQRFDTHCKECGYFDMCKGGCNANSFETNKNCSGIDEFYCELLKETIKIVYEELRNINVVKDLINPVVKNHLLKLNFYSIADIENYARSKNKEINLVFDRNDLLNCSEFKVFRGINPYRKGSDDNFIKHGNVFFNNSKNTKRINTRNRYKNLDKALKDYFNTLVNEVK